MTIKPSRPKRTTVTITAIAVVVIILLFVYAWVDPESTVWGNFFPKCPVKLLTGLQCPSCGIQRAAHALLHGDFYGALKQNWFLIFSIGYLISLLFTKYFCQPFSSARKFFWGRAGCTLYITFYIIWFIVRNILHI